MKKTDKDITCTSCSAVFALTSSTGTLKKHLDKCTASHAKGWVAKDKNQPTLRELLEPGLPIDEQDAIDEELIKWLKVRGKPLALVEEEEFRQFTKILNKKYVVPGR